MLIGIWYPKAQVVQSLDFPAWGGIRRKQEGRGLSWSSEYCHLTDTEGKTMNNLNSLDNCINFLLTGAQHAVFQYMKKNLAQFDITPIQYGVLGCIWEFDMHNPKDIATHLGVENSTISGILERMENKGLIRRMIDSSDRRFIHIELTDVSRDLEIPVRTVVTEVDKVVLAKFGEKEIGMLKDMLRMINAEEL